MMRPAVADGNDIEIRRPILERRKGREVRLFGFPRLPCRKFSEFGHATSYLRSLGSDPDRSVDRSLPPSAAGGGRCPAGQSSAAELDALPRFFHRIGAFG